LNFSSKPGLADWRTGGLVFVRERFGMSVFDFIATDSPTTPPEGMPDAYSVLRADLGLPVSGRNTTRPKWRCPFCNNVDPSLILAENPKRWRCMECRSDGDVIDFIKRIRNLDFKGAIAHIGGRGENASTPRSIQIGDPPPWEEISTWRWGPSRDDRLGGIDFKPPRIVHTEPDRPDDETAAPLAAIEPSPARAPSASEPPPPPRATRAPTFPPLIATDDHAPSTAAAGSNQLFAIDTCKPTKYCGR
jgi:hypothetical protein